MKEIAWRAFYAITKLILWIIARLLFRLEVEGAENIPKKGGVIIASNHLSHLDPPILGISVPRHVYYIAKQELTVVKPLALFMKMLGTILIDRSRGQRALQLAEEYVKKERAIIIFPEGTRSITGNLQKGKTGAAVIALKMGCPVVPSAIIGTDKAMRKHSKLIKPTKVKVRFGKPIYVERMDMEIIPREELVKLTDKIMSAINELLPTEMRAEADHPLVGSSVPTMSEND